MFYIDLGSKQGFHHVSLLANENHTRLVDGFQIFVANTPNLTDPETRNCTSVLQATLTQVPCAAEGYRFVMVVLPGDGRTLSLYSVSVMGGCEACTISKYKSSEGSHDCAWCTGGEVASTTAQSKCTTCNAHTYAASSKNR